MEKTTRNRCTNLLFSKRLKNIKRIVEGAILSLNGSKDYRPAGWFAGDGVPESGAQVRTCDKKREGAAERTKEAKKERQVQSYE